MFIDEPPQLIRIQDVNSAAITGAIMDDAPRRRIHRLYKSECKSYLKIKGLREGDKAGDRYYRKLRQSWWNYYGRNQMITCEYEVGKWSYQYDLRYTPMELY